MSNNPFASYSIEIPEKYHTAALKYSKTGGEKSSIDFSPFERQIDFWFAAFLIAVNKRLEPVKEKETYNATTAQILSSDIDRVGLMRLSVLGLTKEFDRLADHKWVFDYCLGLANAGLPYLIDILGDIDDKPLWAILTEFEGLAVK